MEIIQRPFGANRVTGVSDEDNIRINPATEEKQDNIITALGDGSMATKLLDFAGDDIGVQIPLSTGGDRVYSKDIWVAESDMGDFSGNVTDLVDNLHSTIVNSEVTSPKVLLIHFNWAILSNYVNLNAYTGNFSNVKVEGLTVAEEFVTIVDNSTDNTDLTTAYYNFPVDLLITGVRLTFSTTDTVTLSSVMILKSQHTVSRIQATGPDKSVNNIPSNERGDLKVEMDTFNIVRLVGSYFSMSTKDPNFWTETVTGSGTVTQNGEILLETGTTANSTAKYETVQRARFISASPHEFRANLEFDTAGTVDNIRRAGAYDDDNGFFVQLDGSTFGVGIRSDVSGAVVDEIVESGDFNGASTTYVPGTAIRSVKIQFGGKSVFFFVDRVLIHTLPLTHDLIPSNFNLPVRIENINDNGSISDVSFHIYGASVYRRGELQTSSTYSYISTNTTTVLKYGAGTLHNIVNLDNAGTVIAYDNTAASGAIIASIDTAKALGTLSFDAPFSNGLTIVSAGNCKITVTYE